MSKADTTSLDAVVRHGLLAWIPLGGNVVIETPADESNLPAMVESVRSHPALAVWEVPDEPLWNVW
jgi:hypothetical protein